MSPSSKIDQGSGYSVCLTKIPCRRILGLSAANSAVMGVEPHEYPFTASTRPCSLDCSAFFVGRKSFVYGQCRVGTALKFSVRALSAVFDPIRYLATLLSVEPLAVAGEQLTHGGHDDQKGQWQRTYKRAKTQPECANTTAGTPAKATKDRFIALFASFAVGKRKRPAILGCAATTPPMRSQSTTRYGVQSMCAPRLVRLPHSPSSKIDQGGAQ